MNSGRENVKENIFRYEFFFWKCCGIGFIVSICEWAFVREVWGIIGKFRGCSVVGKSGKLK